MTQANLEPRSETIERDGHVVMHGCRWRPELQRWEPMASIRPAWNSTELIPLGTKAENFQDTPEDALGVAESMVSLWLKDHPAPTT